MTRETKIGLLVGLAFIVVFAMLLSHSGPTSPPGDARQIVSARQDAAPRPAERGIEPSAAATTTPSSGLAASPLNTPVAEPEATMPESAALPTPVALGPPVPSMGEESPDPAGTEMAAVATGHDMLESTRVAPPLPPEPVAAPEPSERTEAPAQSPEPASPGDENPSPTIPSPVPTVPKDYVVQKGETLNAICKVLYGSASARVVDFFMKANHMKNRHMVVEGQKLIVPELPPEMFEPVTNLNLTQMNSTRLAKMDQLINGTRRAPLGATTEAANSLDKPASEKGLQKAVETTERSVPDRLAGERTAPEKSAGAASNDSRRPAAVRTYEVKANDTLASIARTQLGSSGAWKEIQRLNKDVDPLKMKPGTKLKLPPKPVSQQNPGTERKSA